VAPDDRVSDERARARHEDGELEARFQRYQEELGLDLDDADVLTGSRPVSDLFEEALEVHGDAPGVAAWVVNDVQREMKGLPPGEVPVSGEALGRLVRLVDEGRITNSAAREVFQAMVDDGSDPEEVVRVRGLEKVADPEAVAPLVTKVLEASPAEVEAYRGGKTALLGYFVGQVMRESGGAADPQVVKEVLAHHLDQG
jgi:Asp-tRNA(Asn)/Glu-tRNA(Gln) amidotransferase B subunit